MPQQNGELDMKQQKKLSPTNITEDQFKWLKAEKARTGNGVGCILRNLIQQEMNKAEAK